MTRTLRRLSRLAVSGLCLLSLLACVGAGWLWWWSSYYDCGEAWVGTGRPDGVLLFVAAVGPGELRLGTIREQTDPDDPDPRRGRLLVVGHEVYGREVLARPPHNPD